MLIPVTCSQLRSIQFRRLVLKSPPLGHKWGKCAKKLGCTSSHTSSLQSLQSVAAGRMRTRVFSHTYPTYALVGGTSRPSGETVSWCKETLHSLNSRSRLITTYIIMIFQTEPIYSFSHPLPIGIIKHGGYFTVSPAGLEVPPLGAQMG